MSEFRDGREIYTTQDLNKQDAIPYAEVLTADDTITPTAGKRIVVLKSQVLQHPANETFNLVTLGFASVGDFVTGWIFSDSTEWVGDVDEDLTINLTNTDPVSVNIRYKEF